MNMFKSINKVIKILVISDFFLIAGWGLVTPILAIFVVESIKGGNVKIVGIAIGIYWLGKSIVQIPIAHYLDKYNGEKDDYYVLIIGTVLVSLVSLGFIFASLPWHIYLIQGIYALGMAMIIPSWSGIFARHIARGREAFCWSLDSSSLGIGAGLAGIVGGIIAKNWGFLPLFIGVSILGLFSAFLFLLIAKDLFPKEKLFPFFK